MTEHPKFFHWQSGQTRLLTVTSNTTPAPCTHWVHQSLNLLPVTSNTTPASTSEPKRIHSPSASTSEPKTSE